MKNPGRALVLASGTPITNTLGEMFSVQRYGPCGAPERGLHEFDAWASTFGDISTELELQPSGKYRPVTRFAHFVNVPELIAMFRSFADVVMPEDLRRLREVPGDLGGKRRSLTAEPTPAFKRLSVPARRAHQGDRGARPRTGARRRHPALGHHRRPACRDRSASGRSSAATTSRTTSSTCSSPMPSASGRRHGEHAYVARTASPSSCPAPAR